MSVAKEVLQAKEGYKEKYGFSMPEKYVYKADQGLSEEVIRKISAIKKEPQWMTDFRLRSLKVFSKKKMPTWGADLSGIDFDKITYYLKATDKKSKSWDEVPDDIKKTFEKLGIPEAERKFLAGAGAQYDSEVVYHQIREDLEKQGVIFLAMDQGLKEHEDIVKKHFGTVIPPEDNKFSALNSAVWSGGSFVFVPKGVHVQMPLQAYFRINAESMGQFERTLIIAEPGSSIHYIEGCTAPSYSSDSLHSAVVELIAMEGSKIQYTTIQNWSSNVYNLVTKRAIAHKNAEVFWVDGNLGSKVTMKFPAVHLVGEGARGEVLSIAFAGKGQHQDAGAKILHFAPNTSSVITNKSISKDGGKTTYRGLVKVMKGAKDVKSNVVCDALLLDKESSSDTVPYMELDEKDIEISHEASVGKISEDQLFYLMSRGMDERGAMAMIVRGFIKQFTKTLPMEYAIELNRLVELEMEDSVG